MSFVMLWVFLYLFMLKCLKCKFKFKVSFLVNFVFFILLGFMNKKFFIGLFLEESL